VRQVVVLGYGRILVLPGAVTEELFYQPASAARCLLASTKITRSCRDSPELNTPAFC